MTDIEKMAREAALLVAQNYQMGGLSDGLYADFAVDVSTMVAEQKLAVIMQAITDPENQPSQYGTVTLAMYQAIEAENNLLRDVISDKDVALKLMREAVADATKAVARRCAGMAECHDLGTPEGNEIASAIRAEFGIKEEP